MVTADISVYRLIGFYFLLLIPVAFMCYLKAGLIKKMLIAVLRMSVQLFCVGIYLGRIFEYNSLPLNILWIMIMVAVAAGHIIKSANLKRRELFITVLAAASFSLFVILVPMVFFIVRPVPYYDARYLVPLGGMLLGNFLSMNIIALKHFTSELRGNKQYLQTALCYGATNLEAILPFFREAFMRALIPSITTIGALGLVSLPGMLTGQLLGGSIPTVAIKYQIIIMLSIIVAGSMSVFFTIFLLSKKVFDRLGNIRDELYR